MGASATTGSVRPTSASPRTARCSSPTGYCAITTCTIKGLSGTFASANVDIQGEQKKDVVRIPVEALLKDKGEDVVFVLKDGSPVRTTVKPGLV